MLATLADEQLAGRLDIGPAYCVVTAEQCTPDMRDRIDQAWGIQPFNTYATTETGGVLAFECAAHNGVHRAESTCSSATSPTRETPRQKASCRP